MPKYTEQEARQAVAASFGYAEALRHLGLRATGGNWRTLRAWVARWGIPTDHFDPDVARRRALGQAPRPIEEILVERSTYSRNQLKDRLYAAGLKQPVCELCGQGELWRDRRMALILDHVNGVRDDNRLENLRIVCPNCAATLDSHYGRRKGLASTDRECLHCGALFQPKYARQRYCSRACAMLAPRPARGVPRPALRRVERPPYEELLREVAESGWSAVGRRYGVSDNAIRKWVRQYEREREAEGRAP